MIGRLCFRDVIRLMRFNFAINWQAHVFKIVCKLMIILTINLPLQCDSIIICVSLHGSVEFKCYVLCRPLFAN